MCYVCACMSWYRYAMAYLCGGLYVLVQIRHGISVWRSEDSLSVCPCFQGLFFAPVHAGLAFRNSFVSIFHIAIGVLGLQTCTLLCLAFTWVLGFRLSSSCLHWPISPATVCFYFLKKIFITLLMGSACAMTCL